MLDIVHAILEWFLPIFLPGDQLLHKTSAMDQGAAESLSYPIPTGQDPQSPDPAVSGLTGSHFLMVAFVVVAVWLIISNLTTKVVQEKRSGFRENRAPGSFDLPLHGIINDNSDRHIWQENFHPSDLKLKWILERHESDVHHLQKQQIEQDIKISYLSRKLSRRDRYDPHRRSSIRRRPDNLLREMNRMPEKLDLHVTSEDEIDLFGKYPINEERCRCVKTRPVESHKTETERRGNGDEIGEEKIFQEESRPSNSFGQGDVSTHDQSGTVQRSTASSESRPRQRHEPSTPTPQQQRPRGPPCSADFYNAPKTKLLQTIFSSGEKLISTPTPTPPPTPPPRPEPSRRAIGPYGVLDSKLVDRFMNRHPEAESLESMVSISSGVTCPAASAVPDANRRETAPVPESTSPVDSPGSDCAT